MEPNLILNLNALRIHPLDPQSRPESEIAMPFGSTKLATIVEGTVIHQTFSYFLAHIDILEYSLDQPLHLHYTLNESAVMMVICYSVQDKGSSQMNSSSYPRDKSYCCILQHQKGDYVIEYPEGIHRIIALTLRPEWILGKATTFPKFLPVLENFTEPTESIKFLSQCPLTGDIKRAVNDLKKGKSASETKLEVALSIFISSVTDHYHTMLTQQKYLTSVFRKQKREALKALIQENFATDFVDDLAFFTDRLHVSEKDLMKLSTEAFGKPLHKYVIYYRMCEAFRLISFTEKPINVIALEVGYPDSHYFSRAYKKFYKIAPTDTLRFGPLPYKLRGGFLLRQT